MSCTKITLQATNTDDTMYDIHVEIDETRFYTCAIHSAEEAVNNGWYLHYELASELFELCFDREVHEKPPINKS